MFQPNNDIIMKKINFIFIMLLLAAISFPAEAATKWTNYKIMLDPGHGGTDPGAQGPSAPHEATLVLRCGNALKKRIVNECGGTVKMTRSTDVFISLSSRRSSSVSYDPYIFCSIHLNAYNKTSKGTETYYYWSTGNSNLLANKVQSQLIANFKKVSGFTPTNRGVKYGNLAVIKGSSSVPAILTEGLFVDNSTEWNIIKTEDKDGFKKWVQGHLYGFYDRLVLLNSDIIDPEGTSSSTTPDPSWTISPTSLEFSCEEGSSSTNSVTIKGSNLTAAPTASISGTGFSISSKSLKTGTATSSVTIKFAPTSAGSYSGKLTLKSGSLSKSITLTGTATAKPLEFSAGWNFSDAKSSLTKKGWDAGKVRNMTYNAGKLYLVYNHSDIKVVNAQTGADLGNLNKAGVEGGTLTLCDVKYCDGKIVACNLAGNTSTALKVYVWDDDQSNPRVLLNTTDFGGATRVGDYIGFYGTWTSGRLVFGHYASDATRIISYAITDGKCATTPTVVNATTDGSTILNTGSSTRVYPGSNYYWIDGKNNHTARLNSDGSRQYYIDTDETWGTAFQTFKWKDIEYGVAMTFNTMEGENWSSQTDEQKAKNYTGGRMTLFRNDSGWNKPTICKEYPEAGLSSTVQNTNCTGNVIVSVNGTSGVEAWVLSTGQGIAYFTHGTVPTYTVEEIKPAGPAVKASKSSLSFVTTSGHTATAKVTISGSNLENDITLSISGTDASLFSLSSNTITKSAASGEIKITYSPTIEGSHSATLTVSSTNADDVTVKLKGTCEPNIVLNDDVMEMTQVWNYSENTSAAAWTNLGSTTPNTRAIAYNNGKLYVLNSTPWNTTPVINEIDAYTGTATGTTVNLEGVVTSGVLTAISSIRFVDGILVGASAVNANHTFRVYAWKKGISSAPTIILEDATHGGLIMGSNITVSGNLTNGRIWATDDGCNNVLYYTISNGTVSTTPTVIALTDASGAALSLVGSRGAAQVSPNSDGSFWVDGQSQYPVLFDATGKQTAIMQAGALNSNTRGTALEFITFGEKKYAAAVAYTGTGQNNGYFTLIDVTNGVAEASSFKCKYPEAGLGGTANAQHMSSICYSTSREDGMVLDIWVCCALQGVAHYTYNGKEIVGVEENIADADINIYTTESTLEVKGIEVANIKVYSIAGATVATGIATQSLNISHLPAGVYVVQVTDFDGNIHNATVAYTK